MIGRRVGLPKSGIGKKRLILARGFFAQPFFGLPGKLGDKPFERHDVECRFGTPR